MEMLQSLTEKDLRKLLSAIANDTDAFTIFTISVFHNKKKNFIYV